MGNIIRHFFQKEDSQMAKKYMDKNVHHTSQHENANQTARRWLIHFKKHWYY